MNTSTAVSATRADEVLVDPLMSATLLADLAFGSLSSDVQSHAGQHLAVLRAETLELDLTDQDQRRFGDYELLELIGEGGMGVVYRARQTSLDREVAVKLLAAGPWASKEFIERFRREAQNAARMQHPNIVAIYEVGSAEELHFFSMRLVRGSNLAAEIRREGKLSALRAATFLRTIADAVEYAHCLGVLHLDLKPANVLLDETGTPHVADFGLARRLEQGLAADNDEVSGTPSYMAPEQATLRSQKITAATDIWGLGAILYELVTGQPPFLGESAQATLTLVLESALRSPRQLTPGLPRDLEAIILKCMAREVSERYATARALADDLTRFIENRPVRARPLSAPQRVLRWSRRQPYLAAFAVLFTVSLLLGIVGIATQWRRAESNAQLATSSATLASQRLRQAHIDQAAVAVRDGHSYEALPGLAANIREREAQGLDTRDDRIRVATVERSAPRLIDALALGSSIFGVALSPDASHVAVATLDQKLRLIDTGSGEENWRTSFENSTHFLINSGDPIRLVLLRYSPDGRFLIGRNHPGRPIAVTPTGYNELLFDAASGTLLTPPVSVVPKFRDATYSPDGAFAVVRSSDRHAQLMRTSDWRVLGHPYAFDRSDPAWLVTAAAHHVLTLDAGFVELSIHDPATLAVRHILQYPASRRVTAWASSPDGQSVVLGHLNGQVELVNCATGRSDIVAASPIGRVGWVTFSPDGAWFGAVADSGDVLVWDTSTRQLAAPLMHLNVTPENHRDQLTIDAAARTVIASSDYEMALWYLPDAITAPVRLTGEFPRYADVWWLRSFGYDPASGLIATDAGQGELRLWRTQQLAPRGLRAPPLPPETLSADAGYILAIDGNSVQLRNAANTRAVGPRLELPLPVRFAQITADSRRLVAVAGRELYVYDCAMWTLQHGPIVLPNDPAKVLLNPDSRHALVFLADYESSLNHDLGQMWDLTDGTPSSSAVAYPPYTKFRFSPDGRNLLHWMLENIELSAATTLAPRWKVSLGARGAGPAGPGTGDPDRMITDAHVSNDGTRIDVLTAGLNSLGDVSGGGEFWQLNAATGAQVKHVVLSESGGGSGFAMMPDQHHAIIQRMDFSPLWWDESKGTTVLPDASSTDFAALTLADDASMFARATSMSSIALTSTTDLTWLSPPLPTSLPTEQQHIEFPTHLAITRNGNGVVGLNRSGQWLYWNIEADKRPIAHIESEAALLNPVEIAIKGAISPPLSADKRAALRSDDPGTPVHVGGFPALPIPPRSTNVPANLFDLSAFYNQPLQFVSRLYYFSFAELTPGMHRFQGVDYDVRGLIQTSMPGFALQINPERPPPQAVRGIRPGIIRFAALNVLFTQHTLTEAEGLRAMATVQLDYRDGSHERLPIECTGPSCSAWYPEADVLDEPAPRVAWRATDAGIAWSTWHPTKIYTVRLVNPHPEREVESVALEAVDQPWSAPIFFAITAEPLGSTAPPATQ